MYWNLVTDITENAADMINRNMRCIEINTSICRIRNTYRLIETWDVLKWFCTALQRMPYSINRNMRCIEMLFQVLFDSLYERLIETWDVLKFQFLGTCTLIYTD